MLYGLQTEYLQIILRYTSAFFDEALRGHLAALLDREGAIDSLLTIEHFKKR